MLFLFQPSIFGDAMFGYKYAILFSSFLAQTVEFGIVWTVGLFNIFFLSEFGNQNGKTSLICSLTTSSFYAAGMAI